MSASGWPWYAFIILFVTAVGTSSGARSPEGLYSSIDANSQSSQLPRTTETRSSSGFTTGPRAPHVQPGGLVDNSLQAARGTFGDYHSQDEVKIPFVSAAGVSMGSDTGSEEYQRPDSRDGEGRSQAYLLEDRAGRLSVVEERTRSLPGGGVMTWQRTTSADGVTVTTIANSNGDSSSSMQALLDQLPGGSSSSVFDYVGHFSAVSTGMLNNALAPVNQLLDALDAQQQQLQGMLTSKYAHAAAATAQEPQQFMVRRRPRPCARHQAATAATAAVADQQQQQQEIADFAEQFAVQQEEELTRLSQEQQLQEILESNGLALTDSGTVIPLDEAQKLAAAAAAPDYPEVDDFYVDQYSEPAEVSADFADTAYDVNDADYVSSSGDLDLDLDAASMGDYSSQLAGFLNALGNSMPDVAFSDWVDVDFLLLVLLLACTVGMCMLFLQSILQLRTVLVAGSNLAGVATLPIKVAGAHPAAPAVAAVGLKGGSSSSSSSSGGSEDDLRLPLLTAVETESVVEQQQQQQQQPGAGVQRFYNPLHHQSLPDRV